MSSILDPPKFDLESYIANYTGTNIPIIALFLARLCCAENNIRDHLLICL